MRQAYTFVGVLLIAGTFALSYILLNPFFKLVMEAATQLSTIFADIYSIYSLIWLILPVIVIFSIILWVFLESQAPTDR